VEVSRDEALSMFLENKYKVEIIQALPAEARITLYRVGPMVDLCRGPHVPHTGILKAVAVTNASRAFWRADVKNDPLQRVYAITFPDSKLLKEYKHRIEEARKRDHRVVGPHQELFFFHPLSPGSCFFLPHGTRVYNALMDLIREKYWEYEYTEVITPNVYNFDLWRTSGHAAHYKDAMFSFTVEKEEFGMKPMNCPGHCLMFRERVRSYRELPMRYADFGVLHRNELSGALSGLTRVRRFQQDDAHIFCRPEQIQEEVLGFLRLMDSVYTTFGLSYEANLSTRPEGFLGEIALWDRAEAALTAALDAFGKPWALNPGDGAFYGPKIDITVFDALRRKFQCATVQLDFQLPIRFNLMYVSDKASLAATDAPAAEPGAQAAADLGLRERPVIIHRACLGSVERMLGILTEHYAGKWPLWLSPRQAMVVPLGSAFVPYANEVRARLRKEHLHVDVDASDRKMQKKVCCACICL
jgi:threonyl-tRNA synthetase